MIADLPSHYVRERKNGAVLFRVADDPGRGRIAMERVAVLNSRTGEVRPKAGVTLTEADRAALAAWQDREREGPAAEAVTAMNLAAQWAQSEASEDELRQATGPLLLAIHDLRSVLARKAAGGRSGA